MAWGMTPMELRTWLAERRMSKPIDAGGAGGRRDQGGQHADEGGFARAVGPEQAEHFAVLDRKAQAVHGAEVAKTLGQVFNFDVGTWATCQRAK